MLNCSSLEIRHAVLHENLFYGTGKLLSTYPSIKCQKLPCVWVVLDLLRGPESETEDEPALHLTDVDQWTDGVAHVLHQVHPTDVLLPSENVNLDLVVVIQFVIST